MRKQLRLLRVTRPAPALSTLGRTRRLHRRVYLSDDMTVTTRARSGSQRGVISSFKNGRQSSTIASNVDFRICVAVLILVNVASKFGDALAPTLADLQPLLLLALNANDLHLTLTAGRTQVLQYFIVGVARRLLEDPAYYLLGWRYGEHGVRWLDGIIPGTEAGFKRSERWFRRFATLAVAVEPGAAVCLLAGTSRMSPGWFASVNVVGTVIRVAVIRVVGRVAAGRVDAALDILAEYRTVATGATALVATATAAPLVLGLVRWMRGTSIKVV